MITVWLRPFSLLPCLLARLCRLSRLANVSESCGNFTSGTALPSDAVLLRPYIASLALLVSVAGHT